MARAMLRHGNLTEDALIYVASLEA